MVCGKKKIGSDSVVRKLKFDIPSGSFPTETACNLQFKFKCADKEHFKTLLNRV